MSENKVVRNSGGLTECLFDQLDRLLNKKSDPKEVNAVVATANTIIKVKQLEIKMHELNQRTAASPATEMKTVDIGVVEFKTPQKRIG